MSIRKKSQKFQALSICPAVDLFVKMVSKEFSEIPQFLRHDNFTPMQRKSFKKLKNLKDVLFKPADKGGNIVVWPKTMYETEVYRQLRNQACYKKLSYIPPLSFSKILKTILDGYRTDGTISQELYDSLWVQEPTIPTMYLLPKIHKHARVPPGRPIISGNGSLTEMIGRYIDDHFKEHGRMPPITCQRYYRFIEKN